MQEFYEGRNRRSLGRMLSISSVRYTPLFRADILAFLVCVYKIQMTAKSEKYISIRSENLADLKADKTTSLLVQHYKRALIEICTHHSVSPTWVPGDSGVSGNEIIDELARGVLFNSLLVQTWPEKTRHRTLDKGSSVGSLTSTWLWGKVLTVLTGRLGNWSRALASLLRLLYCPSVGCIPGWTSLYNGADRKSFV